MATYIYLMKDASAVHIDQSTYDMLNETAKSCCTKVIDFTSTIADRNIKDPDWRKRIADLTDIIAERDKTIFELQTEINQLEEKLNA